MRSVRKIHQAEYAPIADLITYSPLPSRTLARLDPFLFLNHHGHQQYPPLNRGLPFGPHPHRGMETVTFILEGDILHKDSGGHESVITAGGVQWMTAGRGLIHAEVSSQEFKQNGGGLEILQLWINLPARLKMTEPAYLGLQKEDIPSVPLPDGKGAQQLISGSWSGGEGAFQSLTGVHMSTLYLKPDGVFNVRVPMGQTIFCYVVRGQLTVNGRAAEARQLVEFGNDEEQVQLSAITDSLVLFGYAEPLNEPVVAQGPFVMNTQDEIRQAYQDYQAGKFGSWN